MIRSVSIRTAAVADDLLVAAVASASVDCYAILDQTSRGVSDRAAPRVLEPTCSKRSAYSLPSARTRDRIRRRADHTCDRARGSAPLPRAVARSAPLPLRLDS